VAKPNSGKAGSDPGLSALMERLSEGRGGCFRAWRKCDQTNFSGMAGAGRGGWREPFGALLAMTHRPSSPKRFLPNTRRYGPTAFTEQTVSRSGEIVAKPGELRNAADNPVDARDRNLQERGGGGRIAFGEVQRGRHLLDIERQRERPFVEGVEREGLELARIMLTRLEIRRRLAHGGSTILRRRPSGDGSIGSPRKA
jgi:hypothetical protein